MHPAVIIIDTREQEPYAFGPAITPQRRALAAGDYSVEGLEGTVAVERKSVDDFVKTVIRERERFARELDKLATYDSACIVVEGSLSDLLEANYRSGAHPNSVLGAAVSIIVDRRVPIYFCGDRQAARTFVEAYLLRCARMRRACPA
jgi:ERCC4-type nuclease